MPVESPPEGIREGDHLKVVISTDPQSRDIEKRRAEQLLEELQRARAISRFGEIRSGWLPGNQD
ncbi:MAG TPA: hypothetical protein VG778_11310 [Blastocatellia bacterium]|nr:hypothetical protein [Blastocatellia bacterium]